ncbi:hypothetical protein CDL15_Pgr010167 [Punica granatum]|uniref:Protein kinase domain-containing protein n=1 Tax=Punica granatum TaxID=22663 RepID=A0A218XL65_PUNGR|nr:hypothetical protein CDL15_Pgr010167 [Punica granatum]
MKDRISNAAQLPSCRSSTYSSESHHNRQKLGQGGFGSVYKGKLSDGTVVEVKLLNSAKGSGEEFINKVAGISRRALIYEKSSHINIVTLLGFCYECRKRALIYEFMPNGSLDSFLHNDNAQSDLRLGWEKLAIGDSKRPRVPAPRLQHQDFAP